MGRRVGGYTRLEVERLNAARSRPPVAQGDVSRTFNGDLRGVLVWFTMKPVPGSWASDLAEAFSPDEELVVAAGFPSGAVNFFTVHDREMTRVVEIELPDNGVMPARSGRTDPPRV